MPPLEKAKCFNIVVIITVYVLRFRAYGPMQGNFRSWRNTLWRADVCRFLLWVQFMHWWYSFSSQNMQPSYLSQPRKLISKHYYQQRIILLDKKKKKKEEETQMLLVAIIWLLDHQNKELSATISLHPNLNTGRLKKG